MQGRPGRRAGPRAPRRPVVLVHGILGQRLIYWNLFRRRLEEDGFEVHVVQLRNALLGDIRRAAEDLSQQVEDILGGARGRKVDVVAHSAGGLVSRLYVQDLGGHRRVANLVLLGTPHRGTVASYVLPIVRVAFQAQPGSELLDELNREPLPRAVRITNFWSPLDGIVLPAENSVLKAPGVRNVRVPGLHHWGFLVSGAVCDKVKAVLRAPPRRPAA